MASALLAPRARVGTGDEIPLLRNTFIFLFLKETMTLEPTGQQLHKYLKLKIHHLSWYYIQLFDSLMVITFVMENFADTSNSKRTKVRSTCRLTIDKYTKIYDNCLHIKGKQGNTVSEKCTPVWFNELYHKIANHFDAILIANKSLEELKQSKKKKPPMNYEQKQMYKREKKRLEADKSACKDRLKTILKELFETG